MNLRIISKHAADGFPPAGRSHAIVIGGSLAGLLTARVLTDHFDRVTIIERDHYPDEPVPRKGVPQARHLHALLMRGLLIIEQLFPGIRNDLINAGAPVIDTGSDLAWLTPGGWGKRFSSDLTALAFSRGLLDWTVRRRLGAFEKVSFLEGYDVTGLLPDSTGTAVAGVLMCPRHRSDQSTACDGSLRADLVVDASGRSSKAPQWLEALGYEAAPETVVNAFLGYASRLYQRPSGFQADWKSVFVQAAPPDHIRGGILFLIEGDRWMLTVAGGDRDYPPTDETGFTDFVRSLRSPIIYNAIKDAEPISPIYSYRGTENRLRHYERMSRLPDRFVLVGDAVCAFNPVYGQGMTTAAMGALALDECLRDQGKRRPDGSLAGMTRRFQKKLSKVTAGPWTLATGEDCRYLGTEGARVDCRMRLMHHYTNEVVSLATESTSIRRRWMEVFHMLKPPTALFHPSILFRVIARALIAKPDPPKGTLRKKDLAEATSS